MPLPSEITLKIRSHTEGLWQLERIRAANHLIHELGIQPHLYKEVAEIANVPIEKLR